MLWLTLLKPLWYPPKPIWINIYMRYGYDV
jgi:hypothetical protein